MHKYLFVCDLDGTLLDVSGNIDEDSLMKIKKFCEDGGNFVVCTGRMDKDIEFVEERLGFKGEFRISQNGAVIKDKENNLINAETIPKECIPTLNQIIFSYGLRTEVSNLSNRLFPSPRDPGTVAEFVDTSLVKEDLQNYIATKESNPTIYLTFGNHEVFTEIKQDIELALGENAVSITETSPSSLEVFSNKVSKGIATEFIMKQINVSPDCVYVAGDAPSDMTMFELTEHSYAVQEASEVVRDGAKMYKQNVGEVIDEIYQREEKH